MATNKKGGGLGSRVVREVGVRNGASARVVSPRGVSQIGSAIGNKATESGKVKGNPVEAAHRGPLPAGLSVPLGNECATKGLGVGGGRTLYGKSGSQMYFAPAITSLMVASIPRCTSSFFAFSAADGRIARRGKNKVSKQRRARRVLLGAMVRPERDGCYDLTH
jgi:hypothetical protein